MGEVEGIAPVEEVVCDGGAGRMIADAAFRGVASKAGGGGVRVNAAVGIIMRICD